MQLSDLALASKLHLPLAIDVVPSLPRVGLNVTSDKDNANMEVETLDAVPYLPLFNKVILSFMPKYLVTLHNARVLPRD